jgi:MFS family permease
MHQADAEPARVRTRTFAALADNPDYRRFFAGQGVSLIGTWLQEAAVGWIVFDLTRSTAANGLVNAAGVVPGLFVGLVAGAIADRVAPKAMVLAMQVGQMLLAFLLAGLVWAGVVQIWQMALILALARVCVAFEMPSRQVFLYELVGRGSLMNAIALNSGLINASRVIGPALAGLILARLGRTACFALNGASYLAAIVALASIPTPLKLVGREPRGPADVMGGLAYLGRDRAARRLFLLIAFYGVTGMGYAVLVPAYAREVVRTDDMGYGILLASSGLGATFGALLVASLGGLGRKERLVPLGMILFGLALAAAGFLPGVAGRALALPTATACMAVAGFGAIIVFAAAQTLIQTAVPDELRGRIMGLWMITYSGTVPLASLWSGWLARRYGVPRVLEIAAGICTVAGLVVLAVRPLEHPKTPPRRAAVTAGE